MARLVGQYTVHTPSTAPGLGHNTLDGSPSPANRTHDEFAKPPRLARAIDHG